MPVRESTFRLPDAVRPKVESALIDRILAAVSGARDRDALWRDYRDQMEGLLADSSASIPWDNACNLDDPLSREIFLTVQSQFLEIFRREPLVYTDAVHSDDRDNADLQQSFLEHKARQTSLTSVLMDIAYYCCCCDVGVMYHSWTERLRYHTETMLKEGDHYVGEEERDETKAQEEVTVVTPAYVEYAGLDTRAVDPLDFYLYPSTAKSVESAQGCGERLRLTTDDLLNGIKDFGYDKDAVERLIAHGPTHHGEGNDDYTDMLQDKGITPTELDMDGWYECFLWYHRMPPLRDSAKDDFLLDDYLLHAEFMSVICPEARVVLKMDFAPDYPITGKRPYIPYYVAKDPRSFYGSCPMEWINAIQSEMNANIRFGFNTMNMETTPVLRVQKTLLKDLEEGDFFPGAKLPFDKNPDEISPLELPQTSRSILEHQTYLYQRGMGMVAAQLQLQPKVRKSGEVEAAQQQANAKFGLLLWQFQQPFVDWATRTISLCAAHLPDDGEEWLDDLEQAHKLTPEQLKGDYLYRPAGSAQMATQEARLQTMQMVKQAAMEFLMLKAKGAPPDILLLAWNLANRTIQELGIHPAQEYIGEKPQAQPVQPMGVVASGGMGPPQLQGLGQQGVFNGNGQAGNGVRPLPAQVGFGGGTG